MMTEYSGLGELSLYIQHKGNMDYCIMLFLSFLKLDILLCGYILWFHPMEKISPYVILCSMKVTMKMCTGLNMNLKIRKITT